MMILALNGKKIVALVTGVTVVGMLLFFAGLLIGVSLRLPDHASLAGKPDGRVATAADPARETPALPTPQGDLVMAGNPLPPFGHAFAATSPLSQRPMGESSEDLRGPECPIAAVPEPDDKLTRLQNTPVAPREGSPWGAPPPGKPLVFSVQVAAFLGSTQAQKFSDALARQGYTPYLVRARDDRQRLWHLVRIGNYAEREQAALVASDFTKRHNMPVLIRRMATPRMPERVVHAATPVARTQPHSTRQRLPDTRAPLHSGQAELAEVARSPADPQGTTMTFFVQGGAFRRSAETDKFVKDLKRKGYVPSMMQGWDSERRLWHMIHIGDYPERTQAAHGAPGFPTRENTPALVRSLASP